jgi:hypothetical protein
VTVNHERGGINKRRGGFNNSLFLFRESTSIQQVPDSSGFKLLGDLKSFRLQKSSDHLIQPQTLLLMELLKIPYLLFRISNDYTKQQMRLSNGTFPILWAE